MALSNILKNKLENIQKNFNLIDEWSIDALEDIHYRKLDEEKYTKYEDKKIKAILRRTFISGKELDKVVNDFTKQLKVSNYKDAKRSARTTISGARNNGVYHAQKEGEKLGIEMTKYWIHAIGLPNSRDWHIAMDGEEVGIDEEFSNGLMYPCDEDGDAEETANCRCSMGTSVKGFK